MGLMGPTRSMERPGPPGLTAQRPRPYHDPMIKGVSVSPGVAIARVYRLDEAMAQQNPTVLDPAALPAEVSRFENAVAAVAAELGTVVERVAREVGEDEAAIFRAHRALVRDPSLVGKVTTTILNKGQDAATALRTVVDDYARLFEQIPDEYIRERLADIRDVANRITTQLSLQECPECFTSDEPVILAAPEIRPSQAVMRSEERRGGEEWRCRT